MGRLINTGDLHNRLHSYDGFGALRREMLDIIENIVMDCPTARDDMAIKNEAIDRALKVIGKHIKQYKKGYGLGEFMPEVYVLALVEQDIKDLKGSAR